MTPGKWEDQVKIRTQKEERDWKNTDAKNVKRIVVY